MTDERVPDVKSTRFRMVDWALIAMMILPILALQHILHLQPRCLLYERFFAVTYSRRAATAAYAFSTRIIVAGTGCLGSKLLLTMIADALHS